MVLPPLLRPIAGRLLAALLLLQTAFVGAQPALTASNVGDLRPGTTGSDPEELTNIEGVLYFSADDGTNGRELWKSDPKSGETKMLVDLNVGAASSSPSGLVNFRGRLYFAATTAAFGRQLWAYDPETDKVARITDAASGAGATAPESLTPVGPFLFFTADDGTRGRELWFHRRRIAGNVVDIVRDITPGATDPHGSSPPGLLTVVGDTLFFSANDGSTGYELWKVEAAAVPAGTKPTATLVRDMVPGTDSGLPADFVNFNGKLYFTMFDAAVSPGRRLWQSDGTSAGTRIVDPNAIVFNPEAGSPRTLVPIDNKLYFPGTSTTVDDTELFVTDGTVINFVKDIYPGTRTSAPSQLTRVFGVLFFSARDGFFEAPPPDGENAKGQELWRSDGTPAGTRMVKDIFPGSNAPGFRDRFALNSSPHNLAGADGILFFGAFDSNSGFPGVQGRNLWMSDGTEAGTLRVLGMPNESDPARITLVNTTVYFTAEDITRGRELWKVVLPDADGDGLLDKWESAGIDYNMDGTIDLNLPARGSNPMHKDLFVEADFMRAGNHTHNPGFLPDGTVLPIANSPDRLVQAQFALAPAAKVKNPDGQPGINLHVVIDEQIDEVSPIRFVSRGPAASDDFQDFKNRNFGLFEYGAPGAKDLVRLGAHRLVFRYVIFGHSYTEDPRASGIANSGPDLFISLSAHGTGPSPAARDFEDIIRTGILPRFPGTTFAQEWTDLVAGTFMHELGHALGLLHGGGRGIPPAQADNRLINNKPNYLSVMNYSFQSNKPGFALGLSGVADDTIVRTARPLGYSPDVLPELEESGLLEGLGIAGPVGRRTLYGAPDGMGNGVPTIGPSDAAIDWDADGIIKVLAVSDVNFIGNPSASNPPSPGQTLLGHDDWSNLIYNFRDSYFFKGGVMDEIPEREQTPDEIFGSITVPITSADLTLTKTASAPTASPGAGITYTITVTNNGPSAAANVVVSDNLPPTTVFVSSSATSGGVSAGTGNSRTVTFASLGSGASATATIIATIGASVSPGTVINNTATVAGSGFDPNINNNSSTVVTTVTTGGPPTNQPPVISNVVVDRATLWPANHKFVLVNVNYTVTDDSGITPTAVLSVTSNEPVNGTGDGDTAPDWQVLDAHRVNLRAERAGNGTDRIYTITITSRDGTGLSSQKTVAVRVPHKQ